MNRVPEIPALPLGAADANFMPALRRTLGEYAQAINDAADGRLGRDVATTVSYTVALGELFIKVTPSGPLTITLPNVRDTKGMYLFIKRTNTNTSTITCTPVAGLVDGAASVTLTTSRQCRQLYSDGIDYHIIF